MLTTEDLAADFERNRWLIRRHAEGLTHQDSLIQPPGRANCFNWVAGHVVVYRGRILELIGGAPLLDPDQIDRYAKESEPVTGEEPGVIDFDTLLARLDLAQEKLGESLTGLSDQDLVAEIQHGDRKIALASRLHFLYFHDTFHTGQTELLRHLAGHTEKVI